MSIEVIYGDAIFALLAEEWDILAGQGITNTPFQTLAYQRAWWLNLSPEKSELHSIVIRDEFGGLTAVACFYVTADGGIHFNGCVEETDYLDLIVRSADTESAWTAVFETIHSPQFPAWRCLDLCNIPEASPTRAILFQLATQFNTPFDESIHEVCPVIQLPKDFNSYLNKLDSKQRREIQRKLRRANGAEAELKIIGPDDDLNQAVEDFLQLLQLSTFEKREWLNPGRRTVFHETAQAAQEAGALQLMFMEVEGYRAAALFNFDYQDRIWVYNSGLDPASFGNLSLGVVLTAKAIEHAIENGRSSFDFLRGSETYKYRFGAEDTKVYRIQISRSA